MGNVTKLTTKARTENHHGMKVPYDANGLLDWKGDQAAYDRYIDLKVEHEGIMVLTDYQLGNYFDRHPRQFDAKKYLAEVWRHIPQNGWVSPHYFKMPKLANAPVTLADHEAAEALAREWAEARMNNGPDMGIEETFTLQDDDGEVFYQTVDTLETRSWAMDVEVECLVWEWIAQQMLDFKFPDEAKKAKEGAARFHKKMAAKAARAAKKKAA